MLQWFRIKLDRPYSSAVGVPARRMCVPQPSGVASPEWCAVVAGGAPTPVFNRRCDEPTAPASQHMRHQPKYGPGGGSGQVTAAAPTWPRPGPGCWQGGPPRPAADPQYPPQYVSCGPSLSCQRRNPAAPFSVIFTDWLSITAALGVGSRLLACGPGCGGLGEIVARFPPSAKPRSSGRPFARAEGHEA